MLLGFRLVAAEERGKGAESSGLSDFMAAKEPRILKEQ